MRLPESDLKHILAHTERFWGEVRQARLFLTGGTGFFGRWLLESFCYANRQLSLDASITILTRNPADFAARAPHLTHDPAVRFWASDLTNPTLPEGEFPIVIHAASLTGPDAADPATVLSHNIAGTERIIELAKRAGTHRLLYTSSGAVYGRQPAELTHIPEDYAGAPVTTEVSYNTAYGEAKRVSELLLTCAAHQCGFAVLIARGFAFVGPHLPLDRNFAIGNFIRDGLKGKPIAVNHDGTAYRSYLYAADLAVWLWTILFQGASCRPYNVGSEQSISIAALAALVAQSFTPQPEVHILGKSQGKAPERYVPSTARARDELQLIETVNLPEAIRRTIDWYREVKQ